MLERCEARVIRTPDNTLGRDGVSTSVSCQLCERQITEHLLSSAVPRLIKTDNEFVDWWLQQCPKLIRLGYTEGQMPKRLLPAIEEKRVL